MSHHVVTTLVIRFILHQPLGMKPLTIFLFTFPSHEELANIQVQSTLAIVLPASSFLVAKVFKCLTCFWMLIFTVCLESTASSLVELTDHICLVFWPSKPFVTFSALLLLSDILVTFSFSSSSACEVNS